MLVGAVFAALIGVALGLIYKARIDQRAAIELTHRRDAILQRPCENSLDISSTVSFFDDKPRATFGELAPDRCRARLAGSI